MNIRNEQKNIFDVKQVDRFSHILGRAIAMACDKRDFEFGMPLGDYEIALDEGAISTMKAKAKEAELTSTSGEEPGEKRLGKLHYKTLKKHIKGNLDELKELLTTDGGDPPDDLTDFSSKINTILT